MKLSTLRSLISLFSKEEDWQFSLKHHPNWFTMNAYDLFFKSTQGVVVVNIDLDSDNNPPLVRGFPPALEAECISAVGKVFAKGHKGV